jgi:hypothetical protein
LALQNAKTITFIVFYPKYRLKFIYLVSRLITNSLLRQAIGVVVTLLNTKKLAYINIKIYIKKRRRSLAVVVGLAGLT